jgi:hypothetical protein
VQGLRVKFQVDRLDAYEGQLFGTYPDGQAPAMTCRWRCHPNFSLWTPLDDRFAASNLILTSTELGHNQPFEVPSEFQSPDSARCPVSGEQFDPYFDRARP